MQTHIVEYEMRRIALASLLLCVVLFSYSAARPAVVPQTDQDTALTGTWKGAILENGRRWSVLVLEVTALTDGRIDASYSLSKLHLVGQGISSIRRTGTRIDMADDEHGMSFSGTFDAAAPSIHGTWSQHDRSFPVTLHRSVGGDRPQFPIITDHYVRRDVIIANTADNVVLAGELTLPDTIRRHPIVILVSDVGPHDLNGSHNGHQPLYVLAHALTNAGNATLRLNDRGEGGSTGSDPEASRTQLASDVMVAIDSMVKHPNVDSSQIFLVGFGEGGYAVAQAATQKRVQHTLLLATPCVPGWMALTDGFDASELENGTSIENRKLYREMLTAWLNVVAVGIDDHAAALGIERYVDSIFSSKGDNIEELSALSGMIGPHRHAFVLTQILPWLRRYAHLDPASLLRPLKDRVTIVFGERDAVVPFVKNSKAAEAITGRQPHRIARANHYLQRCTRCTAEESVELEDTLAPELLELIVSVIRGASP